MINLDYSSKKFKVDQEIRLEKLVEAIKKSNIPTTTKTVICELVRRVERNNESSTSSTVTEENLVEMADQSKEDFKMLRKPEEFSGDPTKARLWIEDFKFCSKVNIWDNKVAARRLPEFLGGSARNWYRISIEGSPIEEDFVEIEKQFNRLFLPHSMKLMIANELDKRRQRQDEPVSNFIIDMRLLCREYDKNMPIAEVIDKIRNRVLGSFEPNLTQANPTTIEDLVRVCVAIEEGMRKKSASNVSVNAIMPNNNRTIECYNCGRRGHMSKACRAPKKNNAPGNQFNGRKGNSMARNGNYRSNMNNNQDSRQKNNNSDGDKTFTCYNCGGRGHAAKVCPSTKDNSTKNNVKDKDNSNRSDNTVNYKSNKKPMIAYIVPESSIYHEISINRNRVRALIDNGANITAIRTSLANDLGLKLEKSNISRVKVANNTYMKGVIRQTTVNIGLTVDKKLLECEREILVCDDLPEDDNFVLGIDTMSDLGLLIDCGKKKLTLPFQLKGVEAEEDSACYMIRSLKIPPESTAVVEVTLGGKPKKEILICPSKPKEHVIFPMSINKVEYGKTKTVATNPTNAPVYLKSGTKIADWCSPDDANEPEEVPLGKINAIMQVDEATSIEIGDHLSKNEAQQMIDLVREYREIF